MLSRLQIHGYRSFSGLVLDPLSRINLLVGQNDAGKTTILEAVDLLVRSHDTRTVEAILAKRQEVRTSTNGVPTVELDFTGLFHRSLPNPGGLTIPGNLSEEKVSFQARIDVVGESKQKPSIRDVDPRFVELRGNGIGEEWRLSSTSTRQPEGLLPGLTHGVLAIPGRGHSPSSRPRDGRLLRMGPARLSADAVFDLWDRIALIADEDRVVKEVGVHRIERGASTSTYFSSDELQVAVEQEVEIR